MVDNVVKIDTGHLPPGAVNEGLVDNLRYFLALAESGELRSMVLAGVCSDGGITTCINTPHDTTMATVGVAAYLQSKTLSKLVEC